MKPLLNLITLVAQNSNEELSRRSIIKKIQLPKVDFTFGVRRQAVSPSNYQVSLMKRKNFWGEFLKL